MNPDNIMLGKYSLPFILSIILGLVFKKTKLADDWKPYIAALCGCALGIGAMFYNHTIDLVSFKLVADYLLSGLIAGTAATGIYEMNKAGPTGKQYVAIDENRKRIPGARVAKISKYKVI